MDHKHMKYQALLLLIFGITACYGQSVTQSPISNEKIGNVIDCLNQKLGPKGYAPQRVSSDSYLIQYFYGVLTPGIEKENELQLFVYHPSKDAADFYQIFFEHKEGKGIIYIGDGGSIKKMGNHLIPEEAPGGVATYKELKKILAEVEK